jgi:glycosyltransferase involved in cell wall biosynthesis
MRIGVNCYPLQAHIGGLKQYFITLFDELLEHDADNEYVLFWFEPNASSLAELCTERWKSSAILLRRQSDVRAHLGKLDLYFCPFGNLTPRPLPLPTVVTLADVQEQYFPEFFPLDAHYARALHFAGSTRMADRVITLSAFSQQSIARHYRLPASKVLVAYLSADRRYYQTQQVARAPDQALPEHFIFYPANFWRHKNHDRLLQALCILRDRHGLRVDLVCTGFEQPNGYPLAAKLGEYGLQSQVRLLGYCTVEAMAFLYARARLLAFPSLFEGFGIPLVEAMAAGCPVAAANATSIPEVVADAAILFDPQAPDAIAAAIARVWEDQALREELAARGRARAEAFSAARTALAHRQAFAEARAAFSYRRYLWHRWFYRYYHRLNVSIRWRQYIFQRLGQAFR